MTSLAPFREVWCCDAEFQSRAGDSPTVVCFCARELRTGRRVQVFGDGLAGSCPVSTDERSLYICYSAQAELSAHMALGWSRPKALFDLFIEYQLRVNLTNRHTPTDMLSACARFKIPTVTPEFKQKWRSRIIAGPPFSDDEMADIVAYCSGDVDEELDLFLRLVPDANLDRHLQLWGPYHVALAKAWHRGIPVDAEAVDAIHRERVNIRQVLVEKNDHLGFYDERGVFKLDQLEAWARREGVAWPRRTQSGRLATDEKTFERMSEIFPELKPNAELRLSLAKLTKRVLPVVDGRTRSDPRPFMSRTARNLPLARESVFLMPKWLRGTIKPTEGRALVYADFKGEETALAALLSGDEKMWELYRAADPHMAFAIAAGAAPEEATKATHPEVRSMYKRAGLSLQYGVGPSTLARYLRVPLSVARGIWQSHRDIYHRYWAWSDRVWEQAHSPTRQLRTKLGWCARLGPPEVKVSKHDGSTYLDNGERATRNWPIQSAGSSLLHLVVVVLDQLELELLATCHDAVLLECDAADVRRVGELVRLTMEQTSERLFGRALGADVETIVHPDRFIHPDWSKTWSIVYEAVTRVSSLAACAAGE